jgi:hypothetical protein
MKYIYYWHFDNNWYMDISDNPNHWRPTSANEDTCLWSSHYDNYLIEDSVGLTHRQIKEKLTEQYPDYILIKKIAYHEGSRWHGTKGGSREKDPCKRLVNRAKYREKAPIKVRNTARQINTQE